MAEPLLVPAIRAVDRALADRRGRLFDTTQPSTTRRQKMGLGYAILDETAEAPKMRRRRQSRGRLDVIEGAAQNAREPEDDEDEDQQ